MCLHWWFHHQPDISEQMGAGDVGASVLAGFTFILGFLVVFRSQQAYSRWWEGGTLLQQLRGEWFNAFSNLMAVCNTDPARKQEVIEFQHRLIRLVSLLYCAAIEQVSTVQSQKYDLFDIKDFDHKALTYLLTAHDRCEVCLQWIQRLIGEANEHQVIKVAPPILSRVYNQLGNGIVNLNNARKITEFPIPFPLAQMITFMLMFHWSITAFVCAVSVERIYWCGTISFIVVFSFWSINYIAVELEQPFGDDPNDLPLTEMQTDLNASLIGLLDERAQTPPKFSFKTEHMMLETSRTSIEVMLHEITEAHEKEVSHTGDAAFSAPIVDECPDCNKLVKKKETLAIDIARLGPIPQVAESGMEPKMGSSSSSAMVDNGVASPTSPAVVPALAELLRQQADQSAGSCPELQLDMPQRTLLSSMPHPAQQHHAPGGQLRTPWVQQTALAANFDRGPNFDRGQSFDRGSNFDRGGKREDLTHKKNDGEHEQRLLPSHPPELNAGVVGRCWCG